MRYWWEDPDLPPEIVEMLWKRRKLFIGEMYLRHTPWASQYEKETDDGTEREAQGACPRVGPVFPSAN